MKNLIDGLMNEQNRFGNISVILIVVSVLGGIAAGYFLDSAFALSVIVGVTMLTEVLILAVHPMKRIVFMGAVATFVNLGFILAGVLS